MISAEQNKRAVENLIARANSVTGSSSADLTNAVDSLIGGYAEEWDGSVTIIKSEYTISSGWKTVANQGNYLINGELTNGNTTVKITQMILGLYSPASGTPEYKANWLSVMVDGALQTLEPTSGFTLKITGGDDASNADLIAWLESDGQITGVPHSGGAP